MGSIFFLGLLCSQFVWASAPLRFEDSFQMGTTTFTIKGVVTSVTLSNGEGEKIEFSLYRNGHFLHPRQLNGGRLVGCLQPQTGISNPLRRIDIGGVTRGWWLKAHDSCGVRSTNQHLAVLPPAPSYIDTYETKEFHTNFKGIVARAAVQGQGIEVWTYQYLGDCGAKTHFYPKFDVLEGVAKMPENPDQWPKSTDFEQNGNSTSIYPTDYLGRFITGISNKNAPLLKAALLAFDSAVQGDRDCGTQVLPKNKADLQKIIDAYETLDQAGLLEQVN